MNFLQSRKVILIFAIIALVAVGIALYQLWQNKQAGQGDLEVKEEITRTAVPQTSLPPKFPEGIPIEKNAEILTNLHVTTPSGGFQSTRMFVTQESLDDNFTLYKQYFMSNNWVIASSSNSDPKLKQISARKDDLLVQVVLNEVPTRKTVEINVQKAE